MARILVITDDPKIRDDATELLHHAHDVDCVSSPAEAAQAMNAANPDLILADCTVLGEQTTIQDALASQRRGVRVILMTAKTAWMPVIRQANLPCLEKPPSLPHLHELVEQSLSAGRKTSTIAPSLGYRSVALARRVSRSIYYRMLRAGGGLFDRYVREYRHRGLRFEIPRDLSTPEFRARLLLHRYEVPEQALTRKYLASDATVLELGGCLGVVSCVVNRQLRDPRRHVVFEAHPLIAPYLEANRLRNGCRFEVRQQIISDAPTAKFYRREPSIGGSSTVRIGPIAIAVPTTTLGRVEQETGFAFDSLVIDIEGGEREFFAENESFIERLRVIIIELHPHIIGNSACAAIRDRFKAAGLVLRERRGHVEAWLRAR